MGVPTDSLIEIPRLHSVDDHHCPVGGGGVVALVDHRQGVGAVGQAGGLEEDHLVLQLEE